MIISLRIFKWLFLFELRAQANPKLKSVNCECLLITNISHPFTLLTLKFWPQTLVVKYSLVYCMLNKFVLLICLFFECFIPIKLFLFRLNLFELNLSHSIDITKPIKFVPLSKKIRWRVICISESEKETLNITLGSFHITMQRFFVFPISDDSSEA